MLSMWGAWSSTCALQTCPGLGALQLALLTGHLQPPLTRTTHGSIRAAGKPVLAALAIVEGARVPRCRVWACSGRFLACTSTDIHRSVWHDPARGGGWLGLLRQHLVSRFRQRCEPSAQWGPATTLGLRRASLLRRSRRRSTLSTEQSRSWQTTWPTMCEPRSARLHVHCPCLCVPNLNQVLGSVMLCRVFASKATEENSMRCVRAVAAAPVALP